MASRVTNGQTAGEVAWAYLAEQHPGVATRDLLVLKLEHGWLIETVPAADGDGTKVFMVVNRYGFVEEVGLGSVTRQNAHRHLNGFRAAPAPLMSPPASAGW